MDVAYFGIGCLEYHIDPAIPDSVFESNQELDLAMPGRGGVKAGSDQQVYISASLRIVNARPKQGNGDVTTKHFRRCPENFRLLRLRQPHSSIVHRPYSEIKQHPTTIPPRPPPARSPKPPVFW